MKRRKFGVFAMGFALVVAAGGAFLADETLQVSPGSLLSLLSPPGAGYDSTNIALTTGSGGAVTVSRASTQTCEVTPGVLTSVAANKPCVESGALKVEPAGTNLVIQSADFSTSWTTSNTTVTANAAAAPDGTTTADTLNATAAGGFVTSAQFAIASTTATLSIYVRTSSGSHDFTILLRDATSPADRCSTTVTATATWQRVTCSSATVVSGNNHIFRIFPAGTSGTGSVLAWGAQVETGSVATSYIPTGAATASRAAQTTTVATPAGLSTTEGCAKIAITPSWTGANPNGGTAYFLSGNAAGTARLFNTATTTVGAYNGTVAPNIAADFIAGVRRVFRLSWSVARNEMRIERLDTGASSSTTFAGFPSFDATIAIGSTHAGTGQPSGVALDSIVLGSSFSGCR